MLLKADTRKIFISLGYEEKACNMLKNDCRDDEFLVSRIIFLTTYDSSIDIQSLIDKHHLAENICLNISRHTRQYTTKQDETKAKDPMEDMALIESLKLMFNLTHFCPQRVTAFSPALPHILLLLSKRPIPSKPLEPPMGTLINSLLNLALDQKENIQIFFPKATPHVNMDRLVKILEKSIKKEAYTDDELDHNLSPLLTLIRKVYEIAPTDTQKYTQQLLLPTTSDRKQPLGRGESLSARLLRLSTNPIAQVRESISALLFELSGKDAQTFVQNVGYGFASGFLFQHNIKLPENALERSLSTDGSESSQTRVSNEGSIPVNPITGQTLESEPVVELPPMTQAEKEREAERLFVLFERYVSFLSTPILIANTKQIEENRGHECEESGRDGA
jgi:hypothetical protein